jgi:hypothetical protein
MHIFTCYMNDSTVISAQEAESDRVHGGARWLVIVHQIPPKPDYFRVKVRRRLARLGAVALKSTVYVLPWSSQAVEDLQWLRREIVDEGGEAILCEAQLVEGITDAELEESFRRARDGDYQAISIDAAATLARIRKKKSSAEEQADIESAIARLRRRMRAVAELDFFGSAGRTAAARAIDAIVDRVSGGAARSVAPHDREELPSGGVWVTRRDVFVDRIASAWLIRTFIDARAEFKFVPGTGYHPAPGERRFDMFEAEYTHVGDRCTFEVLLERFGLEGDAALRSIAEIVHDIDVKDEKFARLEAPGVEQLLSGIVRSALTDPERLVAGGALFSSLYESFRDATATRSEPAQERGRSSTRARSRSRKR